MDYFKYLPIEILNKIMLYSCIVDTKRKNLLENINKIIIKKDIEDYYLCYWGEESCFYYLKQNIIQWAKNYNYPNKIIYDLENKYYNKLFWDKFCLNMLNNDEFNNYLIWLKKNRLYL